MAAEVKVDTGNRIEKVEAKHVIVKLPEYISEGDNIYLTTTGDVTSAPVLRYFKGLLTPLGRGSADYHLPRRLKERTK